MLKSSDSPQNKRTFIRAYGEFWSRYPVDWKKKELWGERRHYSARDKKNLGVAKNRDIDVWGQTGIYTLERDSQIVYVGQAERCLGQRLKEHTTDGHAARWDTFSWYGLEKAKDEPEEILFAPEEGDRATLIRTLELLAIRMSNAPLNRSQGKIPGAEKLVQKEYRKHGKSVHEKLNKLQEEVQRLSEALASKN